MTVASLLISTRRNALALATAGLIVTAPGAMAVPLDQWGTGALSATFDCGSQGSFDCLGTPIDLIEGPAGGGLQQAAAGSAQTDVAPADVRGDAQASAALDPSAGLSTPVLKAKALSLSSSGAALATAFAIEGYTNSSGATQDYALDVFLDATVNDPSSGSAFAAVSASLVVLKVIPGLFSLADDIDTALLTIDPLDILAFGGLTALANGGVLQELSTTLIFSLANGESAYFLSSLTAFAVRELSTADAFGTLTASFQSSTGLTSASNSTVPEPGSLGLLAIGALVAFRRRRRARG